MPQIYIKEFSEIATSSGPTKLSKVKREKNKPSYNPARDYYKQLREKIIKTHEDDSTKESIGQLAETYPNLSKRANFVVLAQAYTSWWGNKKFKYEAPAKQIYEINGVDIVLNPELALEWGGVKHIIKLYFNKNPMQQVRANYILYLMNLVYGDEYECNVLDIKKKRLFSFTGDFETLNIGVQAETAYISMAWTQV